MESLKEGRSTRRNLDSSVGVTRHIPPNLTPEKTSETISSQLDPYANGDCNVRHSGAVGNQIHVSANLTREESEPNSCRFDPYVDFDVKTSGVVDLMHASDNLTRDEIEPNSRQFDPYVDCDGKTSGVVGDLMHASANPTRDESEPNSCRFDQYAGGDYGRSIVADISRSCTNLKLTTDEQRKTDGNAPSSISTEKVKRGRFWNCTSKQEFSITTMSGDGIDGSLDPMGLLSESDTKISPSLGDTGNGGTVQQTARSAGCSDTRRVKNCSVPCTTVFQNVQDEPEGDGPIISAEADLEDNESSPRAEKVQNIQDQSGSESVELGSICGDVQTDASTAILNDPVHIRMKGTVQKLVHFFESLDPSPEMSWTDRAQRPLNKFEGVPTGHAKVDRVEHFSNPKETSRDGTETRLQQHLHVADSRKIDKSFKDSVKIHTSGRGLAETMDPLSILDTTGHCNQKSNEAPFGKLESIDSSSAGYKLDTSSLPHSEVKLDKVLRMRNDAIQTDVGNSRNGSKLELEKRAKVGYIYSVPHLKQDNGLKICVSRRRCAYVVCFLSILLSSSAFLDVLNL